MLCLCGGSCISCAMIVTPHHTSVQQSSVRQITAEPQSFSSQLLLQWITTASPDAHTVLWIFSRHKGYLFSVMTELTVKMLCIKRTITLTTKVTLAKHNAFFSLFFFSQVDKVSWGLNEMSPWSSWCMHTEQQHLFQPCLNTSVHSSRFLRGWSEPLDFALIEHFVSAFLISTYEV